MKTIISSEVLKKIIKDAISKECRFIHIVNNGIELIFKNVPSVFMSCEVNHYKNENTYEMIKFNNISWAKVVCALEYFPEQPIVLEFDEETIEITQCVLKF